MARTRDKPRFIAGNSPTTRTKQTRGLLVSKSQERQGKKKRQPKHVAKLKLREESEQPSNSTPEDSLKVDLTDLDVHGLTQDLIDCYHSRPRGIILNWYKRWRLESQTKVINRLNDYVSSVQRTSKTAEDYKSFLMTKQQVLENLIKGRLEESEFQLVLAREQRETSLAREQGEQDRIRAELDTILQTNEILKNTALQEYHKAMQEKAIAEQHEQRARILELRGNLIQRITDSLNFQEINMNQVFVLVEMVRDQNASEADILTVEARYEQMKAEARKKEAHADQEETKAEHEKWKFEEEKKNPDV